MSTKEKYVMILEKSESNLNVKKVNDSYILEGVFAQFGKENNNHRIYEEKEYLPHLDYLKEKIQKGNLLGELDHPEKFDVSLKNVSHIIEHLEYVPESRQIVGRVRLLNTDPGKNAKALVDDKIQLSISSRAAGVVQENKKVQIKKIFTYDLVAEPGFNEAQLNRINESLGFDANDNNIAIYEMNGDYDFDELNLDKDVNENKSEKNKDNMEFVTVESLNEYSKQIKKNFDELEAKYIVNFNENNQNNPDDISQLKEQFEKLTKFMDYVVEQSNKTIEKVDNVVVHNDYIVENLNNSIGHNDYIVENLNNSIGHNDYVVENLNNLMGWTEYLAENLDQNITESKNTIKFSDYLAKMLDEGIQFTEHTAENLSLLKDHSDHVVENLNKGIEYAEHIAGKVNEGINYIDYVAESTNNNFDSITGGLITESKNKNLNENKQSIYNPNKAKNLGQTVDEILETVKKQKAEDIQQKMSFPYFNLLNETKKREFTLLEDNQKQKVMDAIREVKPLNENQFLVIWDKTINPVEPEKIEEKLISEMPENLKKVWDRLDENVRAKLLTQANFYNLETNYQIRNFWNTRQILTESVDLERLNESAQIEKENTKSYATGYMNVVAQGLEKFNR